MTTAIFDINSSDRKKRYKVSFIETDGIMMIRCTCPAGRFGKYCKHKLSLAKGQEHFLDQDPTEEEYNQLYAVSEKIQKSDFLDHIFELAKLQTKLEEAEDNLKRANKKAGDAFKKGFKLR